MPPIIQGNVTALIGVFAAFWFLYVIVPSFIMGLKTSVHDFFYNVFASISVSATILILLGYALSAMKFRSDGTHIYNTLSLYIAIVLAIFIILMTVFRKRTRAHFKAFVEFCYLSIKGCYKPKILLKNFFLLIFTKIKTFFFQVARHPFSLICFIIGLGAATFTRSYHTLTAMFFGLPDVYVHSDWVARILNGEFFPNGVYPLGMHYIMTSISLLFNIDITIIVRVFGSIIGILIVLSIYFFLSRVFKSKAAIGIGFLIYTVSRLIDLGNYARQAYTLPQEMALVFLLPAAVFFFEYLKNKQKRDLVFFTLTFGLTISCHFFVSIVGIFLLLAIFIVHFREIIISKIFSKLVIAALICILVTGGPLFAAFASGVKLEGSLYWALGIWSESDEAEEESEEDPPEAVAPGEVSSETQSQPQAQLKNNIVKDVDAFLAENPQIVIKNAETKAVQDDSPQIAPLALNGYKEDSDEELLPVETLGDRLSDPLIFQRILNSTGENNRLTYIIYTLSSLFLIIFGGVVIFLLKRPVYGRVLVSIGLYAIFIALLFVAHTLGLPDLIQFDRLYIFYSINFAFVFTALIEAVFYLLSLIKFKPIRAVEVFANFILLVFFGYYVYLGTISYVNSNIEKGIDMKLSPIRFLQQPSYSLQPQYDGAVTAYQRIHAEFENKKWTIVSSVDELSFIWGKGWHTELTDFVYELSQYKIGADPLIIPSDDVFFFIEKRPISSYRVRYETIDPLFPPAEPVSLEYAAKDITQIREDVLADRRSASSVYTNLEDRRIVMSKAYYWMQEYKKYFPTEITVYQEDDDLIVYRLHQFDPYALNNLTIDYGYN